MVPPGRAAASYLAPGPYARRRSCEQQRRLGHDRMCTHRKAYAALVAYCDTELPEAWDCMRAAILLAVHLLAMLLTEAETVADETGTRPVTSRGPVVLTIQAGHGAPSVSSFPH